MVNQNSDNIAENLTAEEKLLKLINNSTATATASADNSSQIVFNNASAKRKKRKLSSKSFISSFKGMFTLRRMNIFSSVILAIFIGFVVYNYSQQLLAIDIRLDDFLGSPLKQGIDIDQLNESPSQREYLTKTENNNPFHLLPVSQKPAEEKEKSDRKFSLVGIIWADGLQAIVEDSATNQSHFLSKGDSIGDLTVLEVTETEVIITDKEGNIINVK